jgi:hypothetical protein
VIVAAFFLMNAGFGWWWAGWSFGPRLLIPMLWLLALPLVLVSPRLEPVLSTLFAASVVQMMVATAANPLVSDAAAMQIDRARAGLVNAASLLPLIAAWIVTTVVAERASSATLRPASGPRSDCRS